MSLLRQMLGLQKWRRCLGGRGHLLGQPHHGQLHVFSSLCSYHCCYCYCCLVARARVACLAGVTVPVSSRRGMACFVAGAAQRVSGWNGKGSEAGERRVGGRVRVREDETGWGWGPGRLSGNRQAMRKRGRKSRYRQEGSRSG